MNEGNGVLEKKEELNPWTAVWTKPREVVRYVIDYKPMKFAIILASITGIFNMLSVAMQNNFGDSMSVLVIFVLAIILGPFLGLIGWWIGAGIATIVGTWLGGIGRFTELKMAFAITYIPVIVGGILWIPDLLILGESLFMEGIVISGVKFVWLLLSGTIGFVIWIWALVISIMAIAEAHRFSAWRGLWTIVIPAAVLIFVLLLLISPLLFFF
jgi:hypothetical protein